VQKGVLIVFSSKNEMDFIRRLPDSTCHKILAFIGGFVDAAGYRKLQGASYIDINI
jgi:hypothetical protein